MKETNIHPEQQQETTLNKLKKKTFPLVVKSNDKLVFFNSSFVRMEPKFQQQTQCSSEEEAKLLRSVKKFKDDSLDKPFAPPRKQVSYRDSLVGDIPGAYAQAFSFEAVEGIEEESDSELDDLVEGMVNVKLSKETKARIRAQWTKALIVKVYGKSVGYSYLTFKLNALWKPSVRMDCVNLGHGFFLIKFSDDSDYDKVLRGGP